MKEYITEKRVKLAPYEELPGYNQPEYIKHILRIGILGFTTWMISIIAGVL